MLKKIAKKVLSKNSTFDGMLRAINFRLKNVQNFSKTSEKEKEILNLIKENGYAVIPNFYNKEFCEKCIKEIDQLFQNKKEFVQKKSDLRIFGIEELSENMRKFGDDKFLLSLANHYNAKDTCNAFTMANRIEANLGNKGSGEGWHRDSIFRQFKSIVYLSDVTQENGPFELIEKSHKLSSIMKDSKSAKVEFMESRFGSDIVKKVINENSDRHKVALAKAGTLLLVDTSIIHQGRPLISGVRYALTNYFFTRDEINQRLVDHFSPLVSPKKVLNMAV
jgi:hypothetical protein